MESSSHWTWGGISAARAALIRRGPPGRARIRVFSVAYPDLENGFDVILAGLLLPRAPAGGVSLIQRPLGQFCLVSAA
ncbi:hypothetical protein [Nocardia testacea]|uniref:hypothetical protein n=1 Tax=Nocardia testacea TaxID=248551 RepID=UPI003A84F7B4